MAYVELYPKQPVEHQPEPEQQERAYEEITPPIDIIVQSNREDAAEVGRQVVECYRLLTDADFAASRDRHLGVMQGERIEYEQQQENHPER